MGEDSLALWPQDKLLPHGCSIFLFLSYVIQTHTMLPVLLFSEPSSLWRLMMGLG